MKRIIQFRTRPETDKPEEYKRTVAGKILSVAAPVAAVGGAFAYWRAGAKAKIAQRAKSAEIATQGKMDAYVKGLKTQKSPKSPSGVSDGGFNYGEKVQAPSPVKNTVKNTVKKTAAQPVSVSVKSSAQAASDAILAKSKLIPKTKTVISVKRPKFKARLLLTSFQRHYADGTMSESINPLSAYRKASRVVPWAKRAGEAAGDIGDIASGQKPKDPFYKKSWFKNAAVATAIAAPLIGAKLHRVGTRLGNEHKLDPDSRVDRLLKRAADSKTLSKISDYAFSAKPNRLTVALKAHARLVELATVDPLEKGWDLRDARGRSARVYAPGSRRRERREKDWGEKTDNIRTVRNVAIAGTIAGGAGIGYLLNKNKQAALSGKRSMALKVKAAQARGQMIVLPRDGGFSAPRLNPTHALSRKLLLTAFKDKNESLLADVVQSTSDKIELPGRPDLPGEGVVKFVMARPALRHPFLRAVGAGAIATGGVLTGVALRKPKLGALAGGLGAGLFLRK